MQNTFDLIDMSTNEVIASNVVMYRNANYIRWQNDAGLCIKDAMQISDSKAILLSAECGCLLIRLKCGDDDAIENVVKAYRA